MGICTRWRRTCGRRRRSRSLGSSGVGKSTLVNRLLGREALRVGAISDADGKGRHTTTSRQLVELPGGALLIDTPGMRELQPWADARRSTRRSTTSRRWPASAASPTARTTASRAARCATRSAPGRLDADRLENYRRLGREAAFEERKRDKAAASEEKRRWKQIHQAQRALYRDRDRG